MELKGHVLIILIAVGKVKYFRNRDKVKVAEVLFWPKRLVMCIDVNSSICPIRRAPTKYQPRNADVRGMDWRNSNVRYKASR